MALTGLDIYKLLPRTNCGKCGSPTCLAFAMRLVQKKAALEECPDVSEEAKAILASASEPPIRTVSFGKDKNKIEIGGETVIFRHEKTFYHPCGFGITLSDTLSREELNSEIEKFNRLEMERIGQKVRVEFIYLRNESGDKDKFVSAIEEIQKQTKAVLILENKNLEILEEGLKVIKDIRPLIAGVNENNEVITSEVITFYEKMVELAKKYNTGLVVEFTDLEKTSQLTGKIVALGVKDLVLGFKNTSLSGALNDLTQVRRLALKKNFRPLGYPVLVFADGEAGGDDFEAILQAGTYITKYASIIIFPKIEPWQFLPLTALRQNIYTDPQKPVAVESKLYSVGGETNEKSPLLVTTNFSLTYFSVEPEIVNSKVPSWLLVVDADGLSVMTAWAAEKFTPEKIVDAMKKYNLETVVSHHKIVIPGYVAVISGKLHDLSGWEVLVGPREAAGIPKYLKTTWNP